MLWVKGCTCESVSLIKRQVVDMVCIPVNWMLRRNPSCGHLVLVYIYI